MGIMSPRKQKEKRAEETGQDEERNEKMRFCADCKTTKTPLWRVGPSGPKSLCNACGIRYRKKRFSFSAVPFTRSSQRKRTGRYFHCLGGGKGMVVNSSSVGETNSKSSSNNNAGGSNNSGKKGGSESLRMRLMIVGSGYLLRTSFAKKQRCQRRRKFFSHEEKQAAFSLMALSCGPVSA